MVLCLARESRVGSDSKCDKNVQSILSIVPLESPQGDGEARQVLKACLSNSFLFSSTFVK